jgi:hypothetical protein
MATRNEWIQQKRRRYLAQILEAFEQNIEPHLSPEANGDVQDFKGLVRARVNALAVDAAEIMDLEDRAIVQNGAADDLRHRLSPTGRP